MSTTRHQRLKPWHDADPRPFDRRALVAQIRIERVKKVNEKLRKLGIEKRPPRERPTVTGEDLGWVSWGSRTEL